jgi:ABC-type Fe3+-siderophore transport system permease subunit
MSLNTALAISLGVLGAVAAWLFLGPLASHTSLGLQIWATFIAWGCFYHCGGKESGLQTTIIGNAAGAVIAGITLYVATKTGLDAKLGLPLWAGICVGLGVAAMVLLANVPMFATIPAQVYGFASVVAMVLIGGGEVAAASLANPVVAIILSMIIGAVFGYVSERVAGMLVGTGHHRAAAKA